MDPGRPRVIRGPNRPREPYKWEIEALHSEAFLITQEAANKPFSLLRKLGSRIMNALEKSGREYEKFDILPPY